MTKMAKTVKTRISRPLFTPYRPRFHQLKYMSAPSMHLRERTKQQEGPKISHKLAETAKMLNSGPLQSLYRTPMHLNGAYNS